MYPTSHTSKNSNQCESDGALLAGADFVGAEVFGAAGTSDFAALPEVGATGTSECWTGTFDAGAALLAGALAASGCTFGDVFAAAEADDVGVTTPAITPNVCLGDGATP